MTKLSNFKRVISVFLAIIVLFLLLPPLPAYAGTNTIYLESTIDESTLSYKVNILEDNFNKNQKYDYKYIQMSQYLGGACGGVEGEGEDDPAGNANYCYALTENLKFSDIDAGTWISGGTTMSEFFIKSEGYFDENLKVVDATEDATRLVDGDGKSGFFQTSSAKTDIMTMEYPASPSGTVTTKERDYADEVAGTLSASLNQLLSFVNGGRKYANVFELANRAILIRPMNRKDNIGMVAPVVSNKQVTQKGYVIFYAPDDGTESGVYSPSNSNSLKTQLSGDISSSDFFKKVPKVNSSGHLLAYVFEMTGDSQSYSSTINFDGNTSGMSVNPNSMAVIAYAMPKGYRATKNGVIKFGQPNGGEYPWAAQDVPYITIHMISQAANAYYKEYGFSSSTVVHAEEENIVVRFITMIIDGIVRAISRVLGLSPVNDLIYNNGMRNSDAYNFGVMTDNWWQVVMRYHLIFQAIAWFVIIVGFLKTLINLNLSTVNPAVRESVYNSIKKFVVTGFLLVLMIPITQFFMSLNASVVQIFASQVDTSLISSPSVDGWGGIVLSICYLGIRIYINFIYIMRSVTIALLVVSGPFFISTITFSKAGQSQMFMSWFKELVCNIFIQSVHAFTMAFLVNLMQSGTGLESLVISFSIIPITEMFRNLILAGGAGATEGLAKSAAAQYTAAVSTGAKTLAGGAAGIGAKMLTRGEGESEQAGTGGAAGGKGKAGAAGADGFSALSSAINSKASKLREKGLERSGEGRGAAAAGLKALSGGLKAGSGAAKAVGGIASMATSAAMGQFTGQAGHFAEAAGTGAGMAVSAGEGVYSAASTVMAERDNPTSYDDTTKATHQSLGIKYDGDGKIDAAQLGGALGQGKATGNRVDSNALNKFRNKEIPFGTPEQKAHAQDMYLASGQGVKDLKQKIDNGTFTGDASEALKTARLERKQAASRLQSQGITNVQATEDGGVSFDVRRASGIGQASATKRLDNGDTLQTFAMGGYSETVKGQGGGTDAVTTYSAAQVQEAIQTDVNFRNNFCKQVNGSWQLMDSQELAQKNVGGGRMEFSHTSSGGFQIRTYDAEASQNGKNIITAPNSGTSNLFNPGDGGYDRSTKTYIKDKTVPASGRDYTPGYIQRQMQAMQTQGPPNLIDSITGGSDKKNPQSGGAEKNG